MKTILSILSSLLMTSSLISAANSSVNDVISFPSSIHPDEFALKKDFEDLIDLKAKYNKDKNIYQLYAIYNKGSELQEKIQKGEDGFFDPDNIKQMLYLAYLIIDAPFATHDPLTMTVEMPVGYYGDFASKSIVSEALTRILQHYQALPKSKRDLDLYTACENLIVANNKILKNEYDDIAATLIKRDTEDTPKEILKRGEETPALPLPVHVCYSFPHLARDNQYRLTIRNEKINIESHLKDCLTDTERHIMMILLQKHRKNRTAIEQELKKIGYKTPQQIEEMLIRLYGDKKKDRFTNQFNFNN